MNDTDSSSFFTREEANFLRVAAAFVTIHHQQQTKKKRPRDNAIIPLLPSRTSIPSTHDHIQNILTSLMTQQQDTARWKSLAHHLAQQLMQWDQTPAWMAQQDLVAQHAIWQELLHLQPAFFSPLMVPLVWPQRTNGYAWQLLEMALAQAPLATIEETVHELIPASPMQDLAAYYVTVSNGTDLLSKWAQDHLLQQLLERLHEAAPKRGF